MYIDYFGLKDSPFSIAPNPQFLYMSDRHRDALAHLLYGIKSDGGFILLTGEVGTGKTTVCRCLLDQIPADVDVAFVLNPKLTAIELLGTICDDLRIDYPEHASIKVLVDHINDYLLASYQRGRRTVLIIDEAQNLSTDVLEQLRLLTNLETNERKLLQIILLGQPELLEILARNELRQLSQRVTARFHLDALQEDEVAAYVQHRLEIAGGRQPLFTKRATRRLYQLSGGIPRLINLICDRALLGAYAESRPHVDMRIIERAAREALGSDSVQKRARLGAVAASIAILLTAGVSGGLYWRGGGNLPFLPAYDVVSTQDPGVTAPPAEAPAAPDADVAITEPTAETPVITAVVTPTVSPDTNSLLDLEGDATMDTPLRTLLALWQVPVSTSGPSPCDQAARQNLACLTMLGSLRDIRYIDRPAVIRLNIASLDHYFVITGFDGDVVELGSSAGRFRLLPRDLNKTWDGNFATLWRPPPTDLNLTVGTSGPGVDRLRSELAQIDGSAGILTGTGFDRVLEDRLKQFQISVGLRPDGVVGTRTWLHLENATSTSIPRLSRQGAGDD